MADITITIDEDALLRLMSARQMESHRWRTLAGELREFNDFAGASYEACADDAAADVEAAFAACCEADTAEPADWRRAAA